MKCWLEAKADEGFVLMDDFVLVLGRLTFALGQMEFVRPFVAPLYAWAAAVGCRGRVRLPWSVLFLFKYIAMEFSTEKCMIEVGQGALGPGFQGRCKGRG